MKEIGEKIEFIFSEKKQSNETERQRLLRLMKDQIGTLMTEIKETLVEANSTKGC
jgi:hypothetical protein